MVDDSLEQKINSEKKASRKEWLVDTLGNITYSVLVGGAIDYKSGLRTIEGIAASRTTGTIANFFTGGIYGKWRNYVFEKAYELTNTNEESNKLKKYAVDFIADLCAFIPGQIPIYIISRSIGGLVSDGEVNFNEVINGAIDLTIISPLISYTMGIYMDGFRKLFGLKSARKKAETYEKK